MGRSSKANFQADQRNPRAIRHGTDGPRPIDETLRRQLRDRVAASIAPLRASRQRVAYALDDEISWGAFVTPLPGGSTTTTRPISDGWRRTTGAARRRPPS